MAAVPVVLQVMVYPKDKSVKPYPATLAGFATIAGLEVGGGPVVPPGSELPPEVPPEVWPPIDLHPDHTLPGDLPHPEHPIAPGGPPPRPTHPIVLPPIPPEIPPDPPVSTQPIKPNAWNWNDGTNPAYPNTGWFYVHVPGAGQPGPKKK